MVVFVVVMVVMSYGGVCGGCSVVGSGGWCCWLWFLYFYSCLLSMANNCFSISIHFNAFSDNQ